MQNCLSSQSGAEFKGAPFRSRKGETPEWKRKGLWRWQCPRGVDGHLLRINSFTRGPAPAICAVFALAVAGQEGSGLVSPQRRREPPERPPAPRAACCRVSGPCHFRNFVDWEGPAENRSCGGPGCGAAARGGGGARLGDWNQMCWRSRRGDPALGSAASAAAALRVPLSWASGQTLRGP